MLETEAVAKRQSYLGDRAPGQDRECGLGVGTILQRPGTFAADTRRLLVVDASELKDDLVEDMIAVLTSMWARLYGRRSAKNRAKRAMALIREK